MKLERVLRKIEKLTKIKLERLNQSWQDPLKLESDHRSCKVLNEISNLERSIEF